MISKAFSLVELLVVLAIIGILVGLLLPAVQSVREAARRASCQNNIRQITLGLENYHSQHNHFPHGWNQKQGIANSGWGWLAYELPFLERNNLQQQINFNQLVSDEQFGEIINHRVDTLFCPSSADKAITSTSVAGEHPDNLADEPTFEFPVSMARTQYVGCIGSIADSDVILADL